MRAKTFVAVGHETANKGEHGKNLRRDTMDANLLSNMELGIHADAAPGRQTSDVVLRSPECPCPSLCSRLEAPAADGLMTHADAAPGRHAQALMACRPCSQC